VRRLTPITPTVVVPSGLTILGSCTVVSVPVVETVTPAKSMVNNADCEGVAEDEVDEDEDEEEDEEVDEALVVELELLS